MKKNLYLPFILLAGLFFNSCQKDSLLEIEMTDDGLRTFSEGPLTFDPVACVDVDHDFTITVPLRTNAQVQYYSHSAGDWIQIFLVPRSNKEIYNFKYKFTETGVFPLRYKIGGGGYSNGYEIEVLACENECIGGSGYAGSTVGENNGTPGQGFNNAWWYAFDVEGDEEQPVWGEDQQIGIATLAEGNITIEFNEGWSLQDLDDSVKYYTYADGSLPDAGRPTPGQASHKGSSLIIELDDDARYYVIHLDVQYCE